MPESRPKKIVYLFGAGATNAELSAAGVDLTESGLLISDVTRRVTLRAKEEADFLGKNRMFLERAADSSNIELFISLVENNAYEIDGAPIVIERLKTLVEEDIRRVLTPERSNAFCLHKALFELHQANESEIILGLISLNYDTVLDEAYKSFHGDPDYAFSFPQKIENKIPLLKLHGSFGWGEVELSGKKRKIPIIPVGAHKNYLRLPYNFIWGRALELLTECDVLRVIGCSLSPNDAQVIDLLFKAHIPRGVAFEIEVISSEQTGQDIRSRYDFFPRVVTAEKIEEPLISDTRSGTNVFMEWLKAKGRKVMKEDERIAKTLFLKRIIL